MLSLNKIHLLSFFCCLNNVIVLIGHIFVRLFVVAAIGQVIVTQSHYHLNCQHLRFGQQECMSRCVSVRRKLDASLHWKAVDERSDCKAICRTKYQVCEVVRQVERQVDCI